MGKAMTTEKPQLINEAADALRSEAKAVLNSLLKTPEGCSNGSAERFVDCVIGAAVLEIASIQKEAAAEIERLRSALDDALEGQRTQYMTPDELAKHQVALNAALRNALDAP